MGVGGQDGCRGEGSSEVGFERTLINVTLSGWLTGLVQDILVKELLGGARHTVDSLFPDITAIGLTILVIRAHKQADRTYQIIHSGSAHDEHAVIIGPLIVILVGAIISTLRTVKDLVRRRHQSNILHPIPSLDSPFRIGLVASVQGQSRGQVEEASVRDGVFVSITVVEWENLPSQATIAHIRTPPFCLGIEDSLGKSEPLWLVRGGVLEVRFGSCHGRQAPKALIIVSQGSRLVFGHEIKLVANLMQHCCHYYIVIGRVAGVVPVVDHRTEPWVIR